MVKYMTSYILTLFFLNNVKKITFCTKIVARNVDLHNFLWLHGKKPQIKKSRQIFGVENSYRLRNLKKTKNKELNS